MPQYLSLSLAVCVRDVDRAFDRQDEDTITLEAFKQRGMRNKAILSVYSIFDFFFRPSIAAMDAHFVCSNTR